MKIMRALRGEEGASLLEILVATVLLGIVALAFSGGLATETEATVVTDGQTTAESLARSELEYAKRYSYQIGATEYPVDPSLSVPANWMVLPCSVQPAHVSDDGSQKLTVTVQHNGRTVFSLQGYKQQ